ncbi:MAG: hypothetical protein U1E28_21850 [Beijerinckiaceae bacterium]
MIFKLTIWLPAVAFLVLIATNESGLAASCSFPLAQPAESSCDGLVVSAGQSGVVANAGRIGNSRTISGVDTFGTITSLTNSAGALITGGSRDGITIESTGTIGVLNNDGFIRGFGAAGIYNTSSSATTFTIRNGSSGNIAGVGTGISLASSNTTEIINQGLIGGLLESIQNSGSGAVSILNSGTIGGSPFSIINDQSGNIAIIANSGVISGGTSLINSGVIGSLVNSGTISALIQNGGQIGMLTNTGSIQSSGIYNFGTLTVLNNSQGVGGQGGALKYRGSLPTFYNIIVASTGYGQLSVTNASGAMSFGVFNGDPVNNVPASSPQARARYTNVLSGVSVTNLTTQAGSYNGLPWKLVLESGSQTTWDLVFSPFGPSATNTTLALAPNRDSIRNALHLRFATLAAVTDYDCSAFDKLGFCISFQARYTGTVGANDGAGVLIAAYRLADSIRIGGFIDYRVTQGNAVGLRYGQDTPTFGGFIAYNQNNDGTGFQAKITAGYNSTGVAITRTPLDDAEPGSGATSLRSFVLGGQVAWGLAIGNSTVIAPYAGLRYINTTRNAYSENFNLLVQYPVFYNPYFERVTTAFAGARLNGMLTPRIGYQAAAGAEYDLRQNANAYSGTSAIPGLETWAIGHGGGANRFRPVASVGLSYAVAPNQNLIANVGVRGQSFSSSVALTTLAGYRASF